MTKNPFMRLVALFLVLCLAAEPSAVAIVGAGHCPRPPWELHETAGRCGGLPLHELFASQALARPGAVGFRPAGAELPARLSRMEWQSFESRETLLDLIRARLRQKGLGALTLVIADGISDPFIFPMKNAKMASDPRINSSSWGVEEGISKLEEHLNNQPYRVRKTAEFIATAKIKERRTKGNAVHKNRLMNERWEIFHPQIAQKIDKLEKKLAPLKELAAAASSWVHEAATELGDRILRRTAEHALYDLREVLDVARIALMALPPTLRGSYQLRLFGFEALCEGADQALNPARLPHATREAA